MTSPVTTTTATARRPRSEAFQELTPVALVVVAEAAWISVVGGFIQEIRLQGPVLTIPMLTGFVVAGLVAARALGPRLGRSWAFAGLGLSVLAGLTGWLLAPGARAALAQGDLVTALGENPGGWVAGLAVLRGFANARFPLSDATCAQMLRLGIPGIALIALAGGAIAQPWRGIFLADTLVAAVTFVACGTFALAFARQRTVGANLHVDWRRNWSWVALLAGAVVIAIGVALVSAGVVGAAIPVLLGIAMGPFLIVGLVFGTNRGTVRVVGFVVAGAVLVYLVVTTVFATPPATPPTSGGGAPPAMPNTDPGVIIGLGGLGLIVSILALLILIRLWMGQVGPVEADPDEIRTIDRGDAPEAVRRAPRRRRHRTPVDASGAYLALIEDIEGRPTARREPTETPAEHARRLREAGSGAFGLDLLAADYALVAFGAAPLSALEDRRAVARWRHLRARLGKG